MSTLAIVAVVAVAGVGSWAYWNDTESSNNNYIEAGSIDLLVDGENLDGSAHIIVENVFPGAEATMNGEVSNVGTLPGALELTVSNVVNDENSLIEPEAEDGDTTSVVGELCDELIVEVSYDNSVFHTGPLSGMGNVSLGTLNPGPPVSYSITATVDPTADNVIMTDRCTFDVVAVLSQTIE